MGYPNWYLYYRLMHATRNHPEVRLAAQDLLIDLRSKAQKEWPEATDQDVQDWFEHLSHNPTNFSVREALHLTRMEPWARCAPTA